MSTSALAIQVRTFVAVELPAAVLEVLGIVQERLRGAQVPLRLTAPAAIHLTLAFTGEIPAARVTDLAAAAARAAAGVEPFTARAEGIGMFPNARAPRVVWAGVQGDAAAMAALTALQARLGHELDEAGFARDVRFDPHLTLGRVLDRATAAERAAVGAAVQALPTFAPVPVPVRAISVMRSDLPAGGAIYSRLAEVPLGSAP